MSVLPPNQSRDNDRALIAADRARLLAHVRAQLGIELTPLSLWLHPAWLAVRLHRKAHRLWTQGKNKRARIVYQLTCILTGADIHPNATLGPGLLIPAPHGVNISGVAGTNATFLSRSGMGIVHSDRDVGAGPGLPVIEDDVTMGPCSGPLGAVRTGSNVVMGPRCAPVKDTAPNQRILRAARADIAPISSKPDTHLPPRPPHPCPHASLGSTLRDIAADLDRHHAERTGSATPPGLGARISALCTNLCALLVIHRIAHLCSANGLASLASGVAACNTWIFKVTIAPSACIHAGLFLPHPTGAVIYARLGPAATLYAGAICVPQRTLEAARPIDTPHLGARCIIGGQAAALGPITMGDHARIAPMVTLTHDVPHDSITLSPVVRMTQRPRDTTPSTTPPAPPIGDRRSLRRADRARLAAITGRTRLFQRLTMRLTPANIAVALFRRSAAAHARGQPHAAQLLRQLSMLLTGADLDPRSRIGPGLAIPYPAGVSLFAHAGANLTMLALSGIDPDPEHPHTPATLADNIHLGHQSQVSGRISLASNVTIENGALAELDVPANHRVLPPRTRTMRSAPHQEREP